MLLPIPYYLYYTYAWNIALAAIQPVTHMPITTNYNPELNILFGSIEGIISLEEAQAALNAIVTSNDFPPDVDTLWDVRLMDTAQVNTDFEKMLLAMRQDKDNLRGNARIAIVASSDIAFGIGQHYEGKSLGLSQNIHVFREPDVAKGWLLSPK